MLCQHCYSRKTIPQRTVCSTCKSKIYRAKFRIKYAFDALRHNAKRRGHGFDLTLQQFTQFAIDTDYMVRKGRTLHSYSIDRIDNNRGYNVDNIRVMTVSDNSRKFTKKVVYDVEHGDFYTVLLNPTKTTTHNDLDCPF
jgi:hypothetical protein